MTLKRVVTITLSYHEAPQTYTAQAAVLLFFTAAAFQYSYGDEALCSRVPRYFEAYPIMHVFWHYALLNLRNRHQ